MRCRMFDDVVMRREMLSIGFTRRSKFVYEASWSTQDVQHFIYFGEDSRQYLVGRFGLRNQPAEEFGIDSVIKYGHPNLALIRHSRDPQTACSMNFEFDRINETSRASWPRIRITDMLGSELATFVAQFIKRHICPLTRHIIDLRSFLAFLVADREPTPWFASGPATRAAQLTAIAVRLEIGTNEIRELLRPHDRSISVDVFEKRLDPKTCVDRYLDHLISDWSKMVLAGVRKEHG